LAGLSNQRDFDTEFDFDLNQPGTTIIVVELSYQLCHSSAIGLEALRVTVDKLARAYGFLWALRDLNLDLTPGQCVALLGPNGAGKTTLLKLLSGLITPTTGEIRFDGVIFSRSMPELRARVGLLAPSDHLYDNLTARENLTFFSRLYKQSVVPESLDSALEQVGLAERAGDYVANLSSGMKCRLSIAKWMLLQPELLLVDEPYGVLDGSGIRLLENFLKHQCTCGSIVVMASHHVSRALDLCNRVVILSQGRLSFNEAKRQPWPAFETAFSEFLPHGGS
jgi:heme ABC exporter ATP-binding subunit CcmA